MLRTIVVIHGKGTSVSIHDPIGLERLRNWVNEKRNDWVGLNLPPKLSSSADSNEPCTVHIYTMEVGLNARRLITALCRVK